MQRCVGKVLAGEGDVKKDERCDRQRPQSLLPPTHAKLSPMTCALDLPPVLPLAPANPPPLQTKYLAHVLKKIVNCIGIFEKFLT
jgi:hypothetical protein